MITEYKTGAELVEANRDFLETNPYLSVFFKLDSPLLQQTDKGNYALKCEAKGKALLAMKVEPFHLLLFGEAECVPELLRFLISGGYELKHYLCRTDLGDAMIEELRERYGIRYEEVLAMDFMEAREETEASSAEVQPAEAEDLDELCECLEHFIADCGLHDTVRREHTQKSIGSFRLIKENGQIVSMAKMAPSTETDMRIINVYTRDAYRGKGYARKVVNTLKNEILRMGKTVTLNVDKKNPVSYHLYVSLGFKRLFSQGEYGRADEG